MKKIVIIIQSNIHFRNFITSGFVGKLDHACDLELFLHPSLDFKDERLKLIKKHSLEPYLPSKYLLRLFSFFRRISLLSRRSMNTTYSIKFHEKLKTSLIKNHIAGFLTKLLPTEKIICFLLTKIPPQKKLLNYFKSHEVSVVFSPTLIYEVSDFHVLAAARKLKIPIYGFVSSWDNLTTKGMFFLRFNKVLVWGQQCKDAAVREHNYLPSEVIVTGPPHFDVYLNKYNQDIKSLTGLSFERMILFAGTTASKFMNEIDLVVSVASFLEKYFPDVLIWYRPHPRAFNKYMINRLDGVQNVYLDPSIRSKVLREDFAYSTSEDDLNLYSLITSLSCLGISVYSTMCVELAMFNVPSINIAFNVSMDSSQDNRLIFGHYAHLKYLLSLNGVEQVTSFEELFDKVSFYLKHNSKCDLDNKIKYIVDIGNAPFQENILNEILR